jgi:hypothetical protein
MAESPTGATYSKSLFWMMTALFLGLGALLGGAFYTASRILSVIQVPAGGDSPAVHTAGGDFRVQRPNVVGPGLPIYPGAQLVLPSENTGSNGYEPRLETATYHTNDLRALVDSWYLEHLSADFVRHDAGIEPVPEPLRAAHISRGDVAFLGERGNQIRMVVLVEDSSGTRITLERTSRRESKPADRPARSQKRLRNPKRRPNPNRHTDAIQLSRKVSEACG